MLLTTPRTNGKLRERGGRVTTPYNRRGLVKSRHTKGTRQLSIPVSIAEHLPDEAYFAVELTDEGLLYRLVENSDVDRVSQDLPDWLRKVNS